MTFCRLAGVLDLSLEMNLADEATNSFLTDEMDKDGGGLFGRKRSSSAARHVKQYLGISNGTSAMVIW